MDDDVWLKRWNTLKNFLARQRNNKDLDDPEYNAIVRIDNVMDIIEKMEDGKSE